MTLENKHLREEKERVRERFRKKARTDKEPSTNDYSDRFDLHERCELADGCVKPEFADKYDERFRGQGIAWLVRTGVSPEEASSFSSFLGGVGIAKLVEIGMTPEKVDEYMVEVFNGLSIVEFVKAGIKPEQANKYAMLTFEYEHDSIQDIIDLIKENIIPEQVRKYDKRFSITDIINCNDIGPLEANNFPEEIENYLIPLLSMINVLPSQYSQEKIKGIEKHLFTVLLNIHDLKKNPDNYYFLGTGVNAAVMLNRNTNTSYKCAENLENEVELLTNLKKELGKTTNVVNYKKTISKKDIHVIEIEYIKGDTLERKLKEEKNFSSKNVLQYGVHILNGIQELRNAGIYHRDLHDLNIMVDEENDRAVIIDLGAATTNPNEVHEQNRLYGGNNDLISLGLLMYKMATGHNLFHDESGHSYRPEIKDSIKTEREKTYEDPELKQAMLNKVENDVEGELGGIIADLLDDDLWTQPNLEKVEETAKTLYQFTK